MSFMEPWTTQPWSSESLGIATWFSTPVATSWGCRVQRTISMTIPSNWFSRIRSEMSGTNSSTVRYRLVLRNSVVQLIVVAFFGHKDVDVGLRPRVPVERSHGHTYPFTLGGLPK